MALQPAVKPRRIGPRGGAYDKVGNAASLTAEPDTTVGNSITLSWSAAGGLAPIVDNDLFWRVDNGSWNQEGLSESATSYNFGQRSPGTYEWYIRSEDAAGNTATSTTDRFEVIGVTWDEDEAPLQEGASTFVSLGSYEKSTYNYNGVNMPYYKGVGGDIAGWEGTIQTSFLQFDFDPKSVIDADIWDDFEVAVGPVVMNSIRVHDLDDSLTAYSGGLKDLGSTWFDTAKGNGILVINMDDVSQDTYTDNDDRIGSSITAPETRLRIDLDIALVGGGTQNYVIDVLIDWAAGIA